MRWSPRAAATCPAGRCSGSFIAIQPHSEISRQLQLLEHIDDGAHVARYRGFEDWFKHAQDIPGAFYLWLVEHLFWGNELVSGRLVIDGRRVELSAIRCPLFLLAGSRDHITPVEQVFAAADAVSTPDRDIVRRVADAGHLGLFMGREALRTEWPPDDVRGGRAVHGRRPGRIGPAGPRAVA